MYYGSRKVTEVDCKADTMYVIMKNTRLMSFQNELFFKFFQYKNLTAMKNIGFKDIPTEKGSDKVEITDGQLVGFDTKLRVPELKVEDTKYQDQADQGPVYDLEYAVSLMILKYDDLEFI